MKKEKRSTYGGIKIAISVVVLFVSIVVVLFVVNSWSVTITLNSSDAITLEYGTKCQDEGVEARLHGSLFFKKGFLIDYTIKNEQDLLKLGHVDLVYSAEFMGLSDCVTRTIYVVDTQAPEICLVSVDGNYTIPGEDYEEEGFSATDNYDGDLTNQVKKEEQEGRITYTVTDSSGNTTKVTRTIFYLDPVAPEITLEGDTYITLQAGTDYEELGYTAIDNCDGDITERVMVSGEVDSSCLGEYVLIYTVIDSYGNEAIAQRTICYIDTEKPQITLNGGNEIILNVGTEYVDAGYQAIDNYDGDITEKVVVNGTVNSDQIGTYTITYSVTDSNGNTSEAERIVTCYDSVPPTIILAGSKNITINAGTAYTEPGYTASDNYDGDITSIVKVSGGVNIYQAGTYTITYSVSDSSGNTVTDSRIVTVNAVSQPSTVVPSGKVIYLTFDDGPSKYTDKLLSILKKYNVKATFFVVNTSYSDKMASIVSAGHTIALHSYTHKYSQIYISEAAYFVDLKQIQSLVYEKTGILSTMVRFPGGSSNRVSASYCSGIMTSLTKSLTSMGYQYYDWNVDSNDAGGAKTSEEVFENVINGVQGKNVSIVLQHDLYEYSVDAVERIIIWGLANGYTFLPLDETSPTSHQRVAN